MGDRPRRPGTPGFGVPGKPGHVSDPDPGGVLHTIQYHRTLMPVPGVTQVTVYRADGIGGDNVNSFFCYTKSNQDFANYATPWEKKYSRLALSSGGVDPVVDRDLAVVGYYGWLDGSSIWLPKGTVRSIGSGELAMDFGLSDLLSNGVAIFALSGIDTLAGYEKYSTSEQKYRVVMDPEGRVLAFTDYDIRGLDSADTALLVISLAYSLGHLAVSGAKAGFKALARRAGKTAARRTRPPVPEGLISGNPPSVRVGTFGRPGNLIGSISAGEDGVTYVVKSIILKGGTNAAETANIHAARLAHREMIRRAAELARKNGQSQFKLLGDQANANFQAHANNLAREVGIPGSGRVVSQMTAAHPNYEVILDVAKVLASR